MYDANAVADTPNGDGDGVLQQSHSTGHPYNSLTVYTSPAPYAPHPPAYLVGNEYTISEPVNGLPDGAFGGSMGGADRFINGVFHGSMNASSARPDDFIEAPLYTDQGSQSCLIQPPFQPSLNILPFSSGPINPIQQRTQCPWLGCSESFVRSTDVQRHWDAVHLNIRFHCFWIGCPNNGGKGYCRLEKLRSHQRRKHGFALM